MLHRFAALALCALTVASCGVVPLPVGFADPTAPPPLRAQDAEFRTLAARWFGVWSDDPAALADAEALFAPDADAPFFDGFMPLEGRYGREGWERTGRAAIRGLFQGLEVTPRQGVWLRRMGDRAIVSVHFRVVLNALGEQPIETDGRASLVCERRAGTWLVVHEHTSFALREDWLGGESRGEGELDVEHLHPRDAEFQRLIDEYLAELAVSRGADATHADAPARYFAPDAEVLVWDPTSRRPLVSWSSVAAHRDAPDLRIYLTNKVSRGDVRVWKSGDLVWATFTFTARATRRDGGRFEVLGRQTDVFQRIGGAWKIVHEHASVPFGPQGTPAVPSERALTRGPARTTRSIPQLPAVGMLLESAAAKVSFDELLSEYARAWSVENGAFDEGRIARLYAPEGRDKSRTFADGAEWSLAFRRQMETEVFQSLTLAPEKDLTAVRRNTIAWTTCTLSGPFQRRDGQTGRLRQAHSAVWEFRDARWQIVSEHVTLAGPVSPPANR